MRRGMPFSTHWDPHFRAMPSASAEGVLRHWRAIRAADNVSGVITSTAVELSRATPAGAELLAVAADPVRWRLLAALASGPQCVCRMQPVAGVSAPTLTHHLKALRAAGLVTATRRGRWIDYALAPDALARLQRALPLAAPATGAGTGSYCDTGGPA